MKHVTADANKKQYLISACILLTGFIISGCILWWGMVKKKGTEDGIADVCTVNFFDSGGKLIASQSVASGKSVIPPEMASDGGIFKGWSAELYSVSADTDAYPVFEEIGDEMNAVYAGAVFADTSKELHTRVMLGGNVCCSAFTIELAYDNSLLSVCACEPALEDITVQNDEQNGVLILQFAADSILSEPTELVWITFQCKKPGSYKTELDLATREIFTLQNGEKIYTDSTAHPSFIYLFENKEREKS